jgi:hypothetical protein
MITSAIIAYLAAGALYMLGEFKLFLSDAFLEDEDPTMLKILYMIQLVNHLLRTLAIWPSYALEDFILWICQMHDPSDIEGPE